MSDRFYKQDLKYEDINVRAYAGVHIKNPIRAGAVLFPPPPIREQYFPDAWLSVSEHRLSFDNQVDILIENRIKFIKTRQEKRKESEREYRQFVRESKDKHGNLSKRKREADLVGLACAFSIMIYGFVTMICGIGTSLQWSLILFVIPSVAYVLVRTLHFYISKHDKR